jgi:hypothetical protein
MKPTSDPTIVYRSGGLSWWWSLSLMMAGTVSAELPEYGPKVPQYGPKRLSDTTNIPIRGEYVPPQSAGPVSLTTDLQPNEASTPLLPYGAENTPVEPEPVIPSHKRWTFSIEARSIYDDNIFLSAKGKEKSDMVFLFTPSVTFRAGDTATKRGSYAIASYTPSASFFTDDSGENSVDHTVRVDLQKRFGKLAVGVDGKYQRLSGATPELSDRVDRDEAGAKLRLRYDFSDRTGIETSAGYSKVKYRESNLDNYEEWVSETFAAYQLSGRTRIAAGGAVGRLDVDGRKSQNYQRGLVRVTTDPTGKLTLDAKGGVEFRRTGAGKETTPVFNVSAEYRPTTRTSAGVSVYREVTASGSVENENLTRTGATLRVMQKLGSRFTAGLEAGYEKMEYATTEAGTVSSGREDEYFFLRPSLRYEFSEGRRAEIYYSLRRDNSTISDFDFAANQAGLAVGFDF